MIPLKGDVPGQSPTLPSTGAPGRNGTVHMQNPHSPGAGIGQEAAAAPAASSAAAPLERQSKVRREHDTPLGLSTMGTGCPGFWELYVPHVEECGGECTPTPAETPVLHMGHIERGHTAGISICSAPATW